MKRNAFKMKLTPGLVEEYKRRHDEIWPELCEELRRAGTSDYSIFYDEETSILFAVQKLADDNTADDLPNNPVVRKWWDYMNDGIMEYNPDNTPPAVRLREVFHMD
jgi:L-rhamnose mutarotase